MNNEETDSLNPIEQNVLQILESAGSTGMLRSEIYDSDDNQMAEHIQQVSTALKYYLIRPHKTHDAAVEDTLIFIRANIGAGHIIVGTTGQ